MGGKLWFSGQTERGAEEVWRCGDGTLGGSVRLPRTTLGNQNETFVTLDDIVYYYARFPGAVAGLGRSDGTAAGTYQVNNLPPGNTASDLGNLTAAGNWLYFTAVDGKRGREIWRSDGTAKGTRLVHETARGEGSTQPESFTADGDALYFLGGQLSPGGDLWRTDGTKKGTARLTFPEQRGSPGWIRPSIFRRPSRPWETRSSSMPDSPSSGSNRGPATALPKARGRSATP